MAGMFISGGNALFAEGTILVVAIAVFASLTILPAMSWLGDHAREGSGPLWPPTCPAANRVLDGGQPWPRHPGLSILLAGGLLVAAIPALQMNIVTTRRRRVPAGRARDPDLQQGQGSVPDRGRHGDRSRGGRRRTLQSRRPRHRRAARSGQRLEGSGPAPRSSIANGTTVAQINVPTLGNGNDAPSTNALNELRDDIIPATVGAVEGTTVNVTGDAAGSQDFANKLNGRLPLIFALRVRTGVPAARDLPVDRDPRRCSHQPALGQAAYGILVLVFQKGNLESLLGFTSNGGVTNWLPLFLPSILFGLSMDYHVFILSQVKKLYDRACSCRPMRPSSAGYDDSQDGDQRRARHGRGLLVFVTLAFLDFKELGLGLAAAVLIDATIIRGVLLPATMKLLGDWNWYLPAWLRVAAARRGRPRWRYTVVERREPLPPDKPGTAEAGPHPSGLAVKTRRPPRQRGSSSRRRRQSRLERRPWCVAVVVGSMARSWSSLLLAGLALVLTQACSRRRQLPPRTQSDCRPPPTR